ncbi:MAG: type 2 isopentenyl-diphosphate Delta-isomerase [Candidatus Bathyarchaeia archaeon]
MRRRLEGRKLDHIRVSLSERVESGVGAGFEDVKLIHASLPEIDLEEVDTGTRFLNHDLKAPILIEPMTGGTSRAERINRNLAEAAEELGVALGVGSQRAALEDPRLEKTFRVVREAAPNALVLANIGCPQLLEPGAEGKAQKAVEMVEADGLMIHLNPLQEAIQPEGETRFRGALEMIGKVAEKVTVPLVVKETGAGVSKEVAVMLRRAGVRYLDVAGLGGTSWAGVEHHRAEKAGDSRRASLGRAFWDWGIPTVVSLVETLALTDMKVIASGGVRSGIDAAKAVALGAELAGMALPLLKPAVEGAGSVKRRLREVIDELKVAMFLTSSPTPAALRRAPLVIMGETRHWLGQRGEYVRDYLEKRVRV